MKLFNEIKDELKGFKDMKDHMDNSMKGFNEIKDELKGFKEIKDELNEIKKLIH